MRITEKIRLIKNIVEKLLQNDYEFQEIDMFFNEFSIESPYNYYNNDVSLSEYIKDRIRRNDNVDEKLLLNIAKELELSTENITHIPPQRWQNSDEIKAFISHTSKHKKYATKLRDKLKYFGINSFVAHEDIQPTEEWQIEIDKALRTMDFFISMHTEGFCESIWCQQEVGYAVSRNVKIIPVKFHEDPQGFIGKIQALIKGNKLAEDVAQDIVEILKNDTKTKDLFIVKTEDLIPEDEEIPF